MALFQKRHYEWLARWAGRNLHPDDWHKLTTSLANDNPRFNAEKFIYVTAKARGELT